MATLEPSEAVDRTIEAMALRESEPHQLRAMLVSEGADLRLARLAVDLVPEAFFFRAMRDSELALPDHFNMLSESGEMEHRSLKDEPVFQLALARANDLWDQSSPHCQSVSRHSALLDAVNKALWDGAKLGDLVVSITVGLDSPPPPRPRRGLLRRLGLKR